jgi:hypothetical protein
MIIRGVKPFFIPFFYGHHQFFTKVTLGGISTFREKS